MRSPRRIGTLVGVSLALSACSLKRPPAQAEAPVPAQWNAPLPAAPSSLPHGGSPSALADWWRQLNDPLLVELIEASEAASPNLASAAARVAEARATRIAAGAAMLPKLDGNLSAARGNSALGTSAIGASATGTSASAAASSSLASTIPLTTLQAGLQASWEIDLFGRLRADRDAALRRETSADAKWHDARVAVAAEAANAYFAERACVLQLGVAESDARSRSETSRLTELSARAGFTAPADAALARASASDSASRLTQQRAQCAVQRKVLVQLTGIDEQVLERKLAAAPVQGASPALCAPTTASDAATATARDDAGCRSWGAAPVASVPAQMLSQRPDVYSAELAVAAASADVGAAEADRYPKLSLSGSISRLQIRGSGFRETFQSWSVGPVSLSVPIFDGGTRAANTEAAKARYTEAAQLYRANVRLAVREVEEALVNLDSSAARAGDADAAVQNYQSSFDAALARYNSGLASLFELEISRRTLYAAQTSRVALQSERAMAWVSLYRATGGGWSRDDATTQTSSATPSP